MSSPGSPALKLAVEIYSLSSPETIAPGSTPSLDYSRTMKEKSHRVSRRCYRSGVETSLRTFARRLDGYRLYSASRVQVRSEKQADRRCLRPATRQLRRWGDPAQGGRHPVGVDP